MLDLAYPSNGESSLLAGGFFTLLRPLKHFQRSEENGSVTFHPWGNGIPGPLQEQPLGGDICIFDFTIESELDREDTFHKGYEPTTRSFHAALQYAH